MPWYFCNVDQAGPAENGEVYVMLTDTNSEFTGRWFRVASSIKKEMLATALSAVAAGLTVQVALQAPDEYSVVDRLFVTKR